MTQLAHKQVTCGVELGNLLVEVSVPGRPRCRPLRSILCHACSSRKTLFALRHARRPTPPPQHPRTKRP